MSFGLDYIGRLSLSGAQMNPPPGFAPICELLMTAVGEVAVTISAALTGSVELNASLTLTPPTLATTLEALGEFDADIDAAAGIGLPTVSYNLSAAVTAIAKLEASFALLVALEALLEVSGGFWGTGINGLGTTLSTQLGIEYGLLWPGDVPSSLNADLLIMAAVDFPDFPAVPPFPPIPPGVLPGDIASQKLLELLNGIPFGSFPSQASQTFGALAELTTVTANAMVEGNAAIQSQLDLALQLSAFFNVTPPSFSATLTAMAKFQAYLVASASLALPKVQFALTASANIAAALAATFPFTVQLGIALNYPIATMYVYKFSGNYTNLNLGINAALAGGTWGDGGSSDLSTSLPCHTAILGSIDPLVFPTMIEPFFSGAFI